MEEQKQTKTQKHTIPAGRRAPRLALLVADEGVAEHGPQRRKLIVRRLLAAVLLERREAPHHALVPDAVVVAAVELEELQLTQQVRDGGVEGCTRDAPAVGAAESPASLDGRCGANKRKDWSIGAVL